MVIRPFIPEESTNMVIGRDTQKDEEWLLQLFIPETNSNKMIIDHHCLK